jgi:hypothetical protein
MAETLGFDPPNSPGFAVYRGLIANPTFRPLIEIFPIARATMDHVFPKLILVNVLVSGRSSREVLQNVRAGATMAFRVGVGGLHCVLVFTLQAFPLPFGGFAIHLRQSLWHTPHHVRSFADL